MMPAMPQGQPLIPKHGGYRRLKSFQVPSSSTT